GEVSSTPRTPAAAMASASGTVATQTPRAPAATCRRAISGHLCVLACGRKPQPVFLHCSAMTRRLPSKASRSSSSAGVGMALRGRPFHSSASAWLAPSEPEMPALTVDVKKVRRRIEALPGTAYLVLHSRRGRLGVHDGSEPQYTSRWP